MSKIIIEESIEEILDKKVSASKTSTFISMPTKHKNKLVKVLVIEQKGRRKL